MTILLTLRANAAAVATSVGLYITAAYWFTASTSFANPAVTIARAFSDTFAGIRPMDVAPFVLAQLAGAVSALAVCRWLLAERAKAAEPARRASGIGRPERPSHEDEPLVACTAAEAASAGDAQALTVRPMADGEEAAVIALWHACGLTRPWNDPAADLAFARGKANSDVLVGLAGRAHRGQRHGRPRRPSRHHVLRERRSGLARPRARHGAGGGGRGLARRRAGCGRSTCSCATATRACSASTTSSGYEAGTSVQIEKWIDASKKGGRGVAKERRWLGATHRDPHQQGRQ